MPDQQEVYAQHAQKYEDLVAREDYQGNILPALLDICPFEGRRVVELGAGTGRLTRIVAPLVDDIWLFDISAHMLALAADSLQSEGRRNWHAAEADHRHLPLVAGTADIVLSGWSVAYLAVWGGDMWRQAVGQGLREMARMLKAEGTIIILETLGTGYERPYEPENLRPYYRYLEENGFSRTWIRTDYEFASLEEAKALTGFFFGETLANEVEANNWVRLPECTGIWWKRNQ